MPPNMTPTELERWQSRQISAAISRGVNPLDAHRTAKWVVEHLPPGADPDTYVFPAEVLNEDLMSKEVLGDARAEWFASDEVPAIFKRILDARPTN